MQILDFGSMYVPLSLSPGFFTMGVTSGWRTLKVAVTDLAGMLKSGVPSTHRKNQISPRNPGKTMLRLPMYAPKFAEALQARKVLLDTSKDFVQGDLAAIIERSRF